MATNNLFSGNIHQTFPSSTSVGGGSDQPLLLQELSTPTKDHNGSAKGGCANRKVIHSKVLSYIIFIIFTA
jgi:hypothetical protein